MLFNGKEELCFVINLLIKFKCLPISKIVFTFMYTKKCPLRGHCLAPPGRRQRITLKREKKFWAGGITELRVTEGRTDVEFEIVF